MRNRLRRLISVAALAGLLAVAAPIGRVHACSCAMMGPAERLASADAAFVGVVAALEEPPSLQPELALDPVLYTFVVEEALKGSLATSVLLASNRDNGANCGFDFAVAQRWRVFAYADEAGGLTTSSCSGNELLADGVPIPSVEGGDPGPPPAGLLIALGASALVAAVSTWAFTRRGRSAAV
jgi:hypothetical protein